MLQSSQEKPFLKGTYKTIKKAYGASFNPSYWRHGITISHGNGLNISEKAAADRLKHISKELRREMFGNKYRKKSSISFFVFKHGDKHRFDVHFHALMGIKGNHDWSDRQIAEAVSCIDASNFSLNPGDKPVYIDFDWGGGNRFHSYVSRFAQKGSDEYFVI